MPIIDSELLLVAAAQTSELVAAPWACQAAAAALSILAQLMTLIYCIHSDKGHYLSRLDLDIWYVYSTNLKKRNEKRM